MYFKPDTQADFRPPVVIGGVGGSGTRLIAQICGELGLYMGEDQNAALDNLWFTLLFKRVESLSCDDPQMAELIDILIRGMTGYAPIGPQQQRLIRTLGDTDRPQHPAAWLQQRAQSLLATRRVLASDERWGWKEPNSHIVLDELVRYLPGMRYVHVMRHGLDMAYSDNQNQLRLWGPSVLAGDCEVNPRNSLRYWCWVHQRMLEARDRLGSVFLLLNYDRFCVDPAPGLDALAAHIGVALTPAQRSSMLTLVKPPESIGRYRSHATDQFRAEDIALVRRLGYEVITD